MKLWFTRNSAVNYPSPQPTWTINPPFTPDSAKIRFACSVSPAIAEKAAKPTTDTQQPTIRIAFIGAFPV